MIHAHKISKGPLKRKYSGKTFNQINKMCYRLFRFEFEQL